MSAKTTLYDRDFYAWSREQAELLRAGELGRADLEHIAAEIESMGKTEKRELVSRLTVLLSHLLKWQFQPEGRGSSWRLSIVNARDEIIDLLDDNPSLRSQIDGIVRKAYVYAHRKAAIETGLVEEVFPSQCPWPFELATDGDFWP
jgi:Domain of unknown function DUF29